MIHPKEAKKCQQERCSSPPPCCSAVTWSAARPRLPRSPPNSRRRPLSLVLYFDLDSTSIRRQDVALPDQASRLCRDDNPLVMVVSGATDSVGSPESNLIISQRRALVVLRGLVARGIPAKRFQVLAKGGTEPAVPTASGVSEGRNRRVEITWR
ncbi:OmpA family protein [Roseomonas sp. BN140053]|uniref:OmpA family protein n=1 Tax=Roseomonas sp. BN140053 TaxID=3391898 RepID=UPI0039EACE44